MRERRGGSVKTYACVRNEGKKAAEQAGTQTEAKTTSPVSWALHIITSLTETVQHPQQGRQHPHFTDSKCKSQGS